MIEVNILVEGQTEELFIKDILAPYLKEFNVFIKPTIINTKIVKNGPNFKGGLTNSNFDKFINDLRRLVYSTPHGYVTTFIDYYAIPSKFPGYEGRNQYVRAIEQAAHLENELSNLINAQNFIPYIQLHEFEAFLFVNENGFNQNIAPGEANIDALLNIISQYDNPEDINQGPTTAPSKRVLNHYESYQKGLEANYMILDIGLDNIIEKCPKFGGWVQNLIKLP